MTSGARWAALIAALWAGVLLCIGAIAAPSGFALLQPADAGRVAGRMLATEAYLSLLTPEQRKLSDAYFEGGYWLQLWGFLYGVATAAFLLFSGISVQMRNAAGRAFFSGSVSRWDGGPVDGIHPLRRHNGST